MISTKMLWKIAIAVANRSLSAEVDKDGSVC